MIYLVYVSSAARPFSTADLLDLLDRCRENNGRLGITGMLLYKDGNFMQALEGGEREVAALHDKIARDPRHKGMITLLKGPLAERQFPGWSMAFRDLDSADARALPGYSEFLNTNLAGDEFVQNPTRCQKLLMTFRQSMR